MKLKVIEERSAFFKEGISPAYDRCRIDITLHLYVDDEYTKSFISQESLDAYIEYLTEQKNDYRKVIKEIEI
jgi:hypothetical protein